MMLWATDKQKKETTTHFGVYFIVINFTKIHQMMCFGFFLLQIWIIVIVNTV